jgi:ABC-type lipoprotein release transport system permease subunit
LLALPHTGVAPDDPATLLFAILLPGVVAALACVIPARRAVALNPAITLRAD